MKNSLKYLVLLVSTVALGQPDDLTKGGMLSTGSSIYTAHGTLFGTQVTVPDAKYLNFQTAVASGETQRLIRTDVSGTIDATVHAVHATFRTAADSLLFESHNNLQKILYRGQGGGAGLVVDSDQDLRLNGDSVMLTNNSGTGMRVTNNRIHTELPLAEKSTSPVSITNGGTYTASNLSPFTRLIGAAGGATTFTINLPTNAANLAEYSYHFEGSGTGNNVIALTWTPPAGETAQNIGFALPSPKPGVTYRWKKLGTEWHLIGCSGCGL